MSDHETTGPDATTEVGHQDHAPDHGGDSHASVDLGPVDIVAWSYALAGSVLGLLTVLALYAARGA